MIKKYWVETVKNKTTKSIEHFHTMKDVKLHILNQRNIYGNKDVSFNITEKKENAE